MLYSTSDDVRRRRLIVAGVAIALLLLAVLAYAVLLNRSHSSSLVAPGHEHPGQAEVANFESPVTELAELQPIHDPQTFARQVADALFWWDTATIVGRTDHMEQIVAVADPTGESTPGLVSDLDNYLPSQAAWAELAKYQTRQWLVIDSVTTPTKWADAPAQAGDELLPGTTALTIRGTRHRAGVWEGDPVASEHEVAFTLFVVCGPTYPECHLLRLSMLDKPLE